MLAGLISLKMRVCRTTDYRSDMTPEVHQIGIGPNIMLDATISPDFDRSKQILLFGSTAFEAFSRKTAFFLEELIYKIQY
jgi:hypothetical protein